MTRYDSKIAADADVAMDEEFGTVAAWTARAVRQLGPDHAVPGACRGSGSPDALRWMAHRLQLREGRTLLDCGAGVGGPAQLAASEFGVSPALTDPMIAACRAAASLFGHPTVVAAGQSLPFGDAVFDAAWSLGVLCTSSDQPGLIRELRRVVRPGAPIALLVYVRLSSPAAEQPEGNDFPTEAALLGMLSDAGLELREDLVDVAEFPAAPDDWQARADAVEALVERAHAHDERWRAAERQQRIIADLLSRGEVAGRIAIAST